MKKLIMLSIIFFNSLSALKAQNLVPNWSFEQYDTCPYNAGQIYYATGWYSIANYPDYQNSCSASILYTVPTTFDGHTFYSDTTGAGDVAIIPYFVYIPKDSAGSPHNERLSIGCKLITSLQIGKKYYVSFAIRFVLANHSNDSGFCYNTATNKIGALFSTVSYIIPRDSEFSRWAGYRYSLQSIRNYAQVYTNTIISDTAHWVVIAGSFIADSAYTYINIGNFFDDTLTNYALLFHDTSFCHVYQSVYLVDDICVTDDSLNSCAIEAGVNNYVNLYSSINIYPNPMVQSAIISISNIESTKAHVYIYDLLSRKVEDEEINFIDGKYILDRGNLMDGIYDVLIQTNKRIFNQKLIISNKK